MVSTYRSPKYALAVAALAFIVGRVSARRGSILRKLVPSPREEVLSNLTEAERRSLPYPPDALPGARDVASPYGTIRCYEWGPPDGRPVLFVHGISTPSLALYPLAQNLVTTQSCRVLLIDLWGRGYSDAPTDLPYDARLYTTQILLALTSSPISWTGTVTPFDVIGYSLGGGIAANFAAHFPSLVRSLILLTPAGLIRRHRRSWAMRFLYSSSLLPEGLLGWFVKRSLDTAGGARNAHESQNSRAALPILSAASQELPKGGDDAALEEPLIATYPHVNIASAVSWQVARHAGFAHAFIASIRSSPSVEQGEVWARIPSDAGKQPKVLILAGEKDPLILADELSEDARRVLGEENCVIKILDCGHELPVTRAEDVGRCIVRFWNSGC